MKQKLKKTGIILFMAIITLCSCETGEEPGPLVTQERSLPVFESIRVETIGKVRLHVAPDYRVVIHTNSNVVDDINLSIFENELHISLTGKHKKIDRLELDVYAPEYTAIRLDGVADISCRESIVTSFLTVEQDGIGDIHLEDIQVQKVYFKLSEDGNVEVEGITNEIIATHSGVGNLRLFRLFGNTGDLKLSGTGNIEINVSDFLNIDLSGVGDIKYMGSPAMNIRHTGVGKIVKVN
jgi:hypothetical protein